MPKIKIKELFRDIKYRLVNVRPELPVRGLCSDSRTIKKGDLFIAVKGCEQDGHVYIYEALEKGASAICSELLPKDVEKKGFVIVKDTARISPLLASRFYREPSKFLKLIGITGTNGKTTTSYLLYEILKSAKKSPSLLGSVQYRVRDEILNSDNTTPGPLQLHSLLERMRKNGTDYVVMEVSSHALKQSRVLGVDFRVAALTNITGDHLDYHRTMRDYVGSKRLLFESLGKHSFAVLNKDDKYYDEFKRCANADIITYSIEKKADFTATHVESDINGSQFFMHTPKGTINVRTPLIGRHNIYNILAAASIAFTEGVGFNEVREAIGRFNGAPGRLDSVKAGQRFKVFIDYAHTADALRKILSELKRFCRGKIVVVFGCGGNRDRTKRPKMGRIASRLADYVILTNDNPRREDPGFIISEIERGFTRGFKAYKRIPDRYKAIQESLMHREASDIVVIAGKGHEDYQIIGDKKLPFNDKEIVVEALKKILKRTPAIGKSRWYDAVPEKQSCLV